MNFITIEGGDGSGKSTQSRLLYESLKNMEIDAILTREPGGSTMSELIRDLLLSEVGESCHPITELLLINAARFEHAHKLIIPALAEGKFVICDRFVDSTMAYQGYAQKLGRKLPASIHNMTMEGLIPDLTIILDIDPNIGLERARKLHEVNRYDKKNIEFHNRVRDGFRDIAKIASARCVLVDATFSAEEVHKKILSTVSSKFNLKNQLMV